MKRRLGYLIFALSIISPICYGDADFKRNSLLMKEYVWGLDKDIKTTVTYEVILENVPPEDLLDLAESYQTHPSWIVRRNMRRLASELPSEIKISSTNRKRVYSNYYYR